MCFTVMEHYYPYRKCKNEIGGSINSTDGPYNLGSCVSKPRAKKAAA